MKNYVLTISSACSSSVETLSCRLTFYSLLLNNSFFKLSLLSGLSLFLSVSSVFSSCLTISNCSITGSYNWFWLYCSNFLLSPELFVSTIIMSGLFWIASFCTFSWLREMSLIWLDCWALLAPLLFLLLLCFFFFWSFNRVYTFCSRFLIYWTVAGDSAFKFGDKYEFKN